MTTTPPKKVDPMIGTTIGRYQIVELLGRGGMAEVYKAHQPSLDRFVAIKLMHKFLAEEGDFFERFTREAKNVAALNHPNIIQIHDFDHEGDQYYMVMEFVDGGTLKQRINDLARTGQAMPLNEALQIIKDVGSALAYSHKRNMIHRDIKPANVMLGTHGRAILTDFGIAKIVSSAKFTASGSILGTPAYISPEQGLGQPGDHRSDIYSLGVMLYQLVTGRLPYDADTPVGVILKHVNEQLPPPRSINPNIPLGLENIIVKALAKDPANRYQTVDELMAHLNDLSAAEAMPVPADSTVRLPADRTKVLSKSDGAQATLYAPGGAAGSAQLAHGLPPAIEEKKGRNWVPAIIGAIVLLVLVGGGGAMAVGGYLALNRATPTSAIAEVTNTATVPAPTNTEQGGTPTSDAVLIALTHQAETSVAQEATILALQATDTPTATPDFTLTAAACPVSYALAQNPKDGSNLFITRNTKVTLTFTNNGQCAWDEGTALNFVDGDTIHDSATFALGALGPGQSKDVVVTMKPMNPGTYTGNWKLTMGTGAVIGDPIKLIYKGVQIPTAGPPTATFTPVATATTESTGPLSAGVTFQYCEYLPPSTDYQCYITVSVRGGAAPYQVSINSDGIGGPASPTEDFRFFRKSRRCEPNGFTYTIVDASGTVIKGSGYMDPKVTTLFNNNTEVCGLG